MSLSTDFQNVKQKSATAFGQAAEHHPVLTSVVSLVSISAALILLTQLLLH